jgi:hypothetical protein
MAAPPTHDWVDVVNMIAVPLASVGGAIWGARVGGRVAADAAIRATELSIKTERATLLAAEQEQHRGRVHRLESRLQRNLLRLELNIGEAFGLTGASLSALAARVRADCEAYELIARDEDFVHLPQDMILELDDTMLALRKVADQFMGRAQELSAGLDRDMGTSSVTGHAPSNIRARHAQELQGAESSFKDGLRNNTAGITAAKTSLSEWKSLSIPASGSGRTAKAGDGGTQPLS